VVCEAVFQEIFKFVGLYIRRNCDIVMALSVVCNGNEGTDYLEFIAEFGNNKVFSLKCQRGFILITTGIRILCLLFLFVVYVSLCRCNTVFWCGMCPYVCNYLYFGLLSLWHTAWL